MRGQNRVNFWKVKFLKDVLIKKWTLLNKKRFSQFFFAKMHFWTKIYSIVNWQPRSVLVTLNNECCGSPRVERKRGLLIDHPPQPAGRRFLDVAVNRRLIEPRCFSIISNNHRRIRKMIIIRQSWQWWSIRFSNRENKQLCSYVQFG